MPQDAKMTKDELGKLYPIKLEPYDSGWNRLFEKEKQFLQSILNSNALRIEHIGSTAIYDMIAKPTVDVLVEIPSNLTCNEINRILKPYGYIYMKEQTRHIMFVKGYSARGIEKESYHIHLGPKEQDWLWDRVYFRDYLRSNSIVAREYKELKIMLAFKYKYDREAYTERKSEFIEKITRLAKKEMQR